MQDTDEKNGYFRSIEYTTEPKEHHKHIKYSSFFQHAASHLLVIDPVPIKSIDIHHFLFYAGGRYNNVTFHTNLEKVDTICDTDVYTIENKDYDDLKDMGLEKDDKIRYDFFDTSMINVKYDEYDSETLYHQRTFISLGYAKYQS